MKRNVLTAMLLMVCSISYTQAQTVTVLSSDSILKLVNHKPDSGTTLVVNFWATWCGPCVHEMPYFVKADSLLKGENVQFIFISFDKVNSQKAVEKYVSYNNIPGTHYIISYTDINTFIDQIDPKWQGGIPYTTVITYKGRNNNEGSFETFTQLWHFIRNN